MASPSNNLSSSSPISSRTLPNPVLRSSETVNPVRRSFAGTPFTKPSIIPSSRGLNPKTPANSPLDHPQRNPSAYCRDLDEKENGKDLNPRSGRVRSPTFTNCAKNFMSPTISASSKIAMSPKKKILIERNEPVRTSLSSSDLKTSSLNSVNVSESFQQPRVDLKSDDCSSIEVSVDSTDLRPSLRASSLIPKSSKTVSFIDSATKSSGFSEHTMFEDADLVNLDYRFKISPASSPISCKISGFLAEDPSMPPYDPKTNYLSPRPQFLHYRPNPRIERFLHEVEDGKVVNGSFLFESFSDTEVAEESQSDSSRISDEVSSEGKVKQKEEEEEEEEADYNESEPCLIDIINSDGKCQPSFRNIFKITALILLLCFACLFVSHSTPLLNRVLREESSFLRKNANPSEIYQFAKSKYPVLAENLQIWFQNVAAVAHGLILNFNEDNHQLIPVMYFNLTALQEDISVDGYFLFYETHERLDDFLSESELLDEDELLLQENVELDEEADDTSEIMENSDEPEQEHEDNEGHGSLESDFKDEDELLRNSVEKEIEERSDIIEDVERCCDEEKEHQDSKRHESSEELSEENGISESEVVESIIHSQEKPEVEEAEQGSHELDSKGNDVSSASSAASSEMEAQSTAMTSKQVILLIILPLMAVAIFAQSRRVKTKRQGLSSSPQIPSSRNGPTEGGGGDMAGESWASDVSSFRKRSSNVKGGRGRESLSSSSSMSTMDSASYGSFTAYEKISTKQGDLEEEIVTPVRRSSRIKTKFRPSFTDY